MIQEVRVAQKNKDLKADGSLHELKLNGLNRIKKIKTARLYRLEGITERQANILKDILFCENITQTSTLNKPLITDTPFILEIGYKPGVMNPEVASIIKSAKDLGINLIAADSSTEYYFFGKLKNGEIKQLVQKLRLFNPVIEHIVDKKPTTLLIQEKVGKTKIIPIRKMSDTELLGLSKDTLFLNLEEMKVIRNYFLSLKRDPTDCELETIAQTWSEHCAHKTFKAKLIVDGREKQPLIQRLKKEALKYNKNIVSAFVDNSGVMEFYEGLSICGKVETHNSPSAIEPYGGAMTGSGGVFRDILGTGLGAKTIASTDVFCFAYPNTPLSHIPQGCLPPDYLLKRVVKGVKDYGNRMGIPTNNGSIHFHNDFRAKPTVIVGAYGLIPTKLAKKRKAKVSDLAVVVGGRTGRDGVHGATFSSAEMTDRTISISSSAVQIGNAIEEKRMFDAILEASRLGLIGAIQDCGAGGFSSAIGEMGGEIGVTVDMKLAPVKYQGLSPWEIWVSESQERMALAIPKEKIKKFLAVCKQYNVEASIVGVFDGKKKIKVTYGKQVVCNLGVNFLYHGLPQRKMTARKPSSHSGKQSASRIDSGQARMTMPSTEKEWISAFKKILSHGNICSKEPIIRLYDHTVQGTNILQPFSGTKMDGPNDAAIVKPLLNKPYGMVISHGLNPILVRLDPYWGSIWAATEAISNYVAVGGDYKNASLINNYIWPFPDEESLWSLDKSVDAVVDFMKTLKIPVISGKDSLSSTYRGKNGLVIKIPPVLCISVFGKIPDVSKTVSSDFKKENSIIILVGKQDLEGMEGSTYFDILKTPSRWPDGLLEGGRVPRVNLKLLPKTLNTIYKGIQTGKILSCHDISEGGLITAIFEMCVGGNIGVDIHLRGGRLDYFLFNETPGCFIVEVENETIAKQIFKNVPHAVLGKTKKEKILTVSKQNKKILDADLEDLKKVWQEPMRRIFS